MINIIYLGRLKPLSVQAAAQLLPRRLHPAPPESPCSPEVSNLGFWTLIYNRFSPWRMAALMLFGKTGRRQRSYKCQALHPPPPLSSTSLQELGEIRQLPGSEKTTQQDTGRNNFPLAQEMVQPEKDSMEPAFSFPYSRINCTPSSACWSIIFCFKLIAAHKRLGRRSLFIYFHTYHYISNSLCSAHK